MTATNKKKGNVKHMRIRFFRTSLALAALGALSAAVSGQNLTGTVAAGDNGAPLDHATVLAIKYGATPAQPPTIYKAVTDASGHYALTASAGQYTLCIHGGGLYLDPCEWGGASVSAVAASAISVPLRPQKGAWLIIRIHDSGGLLPATEPLPRAGVQAYVSAPGVKQFLLPVIFDDGRVRDYGAVVPMNVPLTAFVSSPVVLLVDKSGAAPNPVGMALVVTPPDPAEPSWLPPRATSMFPRPTATMLHFYTTGRK